MKCLHILVSGRVQGVLFRHHTKLRADSLGIRGFVRNRSDRSVEIVAVGSEKSLSEFVKFCKKGPDSSRVEKVEIEEITPAGNYSTFEVLATD